MHNDRVGQKYESITPHTHRILARKNITNDSQMYTLYKTTLDKAKETDTLRDPIIRELMERIGEESDTEVNNMLRDVWVHVHLSPFKERIKIHNASVKLMYETDTTPPPSTIFKTFKKVPNKPKLGELDVVNLEYTTQYTKDLITHLKELEEFSSAEVPNIEKAIKESNKEDQMALCLEYQIWATELVYIKGKTKEHISTNTTLTKEILDRLSVDPEEEIETKSLTTNKRTTKSNTIPETITTTPREEIRKLLKKAITKAERKYENKDKEEINTKGDHHMKDKSQTNTENTNEEEKGMNDYTNEDPECNKNEDNTEDNDKIYSNTNEDNEHNTKNNNEMQDNTKEDKQYYTNHNNNMNKIEQDQSRQIDNNTNKQRHRNPGRGGRGHLRDNKLPTTNTSSREILLQEHQPIPQFNHSLTNTPTSIKNQNKEKDTLTTHTSDPNSIESEERDTRYIHVNVDIHHKQNDLTRPYTPITEENVINMMRETITQLETTTLTRVGTIYSCEFKHTKPRGIKGENYSTYKVKIEPTPSTLTDYDVNKIVDTLDQYYSSVKQGQLHIQDTLNDLKPYSKDPWAKYTSIRLPCVNHEFDKAFALVLGINPNTQGRHHKACSWIMRKLFDSVKQYFPEDFKCNSNFEFRILYGIRAGSFKATKIHSAYHLHSTSKKNVELLKTAITKYLEIKKHLPKIFNLRIALQWFPDNPEREKKLKP